MPGRLYIAYTDWDLVLDGSTSIYVRYSDDGGMTWSAECKVNDDTVHAYHFHPLYVRDDAIMGTSVRADLLLYPRGPRSGPGYVVPVHPHLIGPIRPTRGHIPPSPTRGLYQMPSLRTFACG